MHKTWLTAQKFLKITSSSRKGRQEKTPLNEGDPEVCKEVVAFTTSSKCCGHGAVEFSCFWSLYSLQHAITNLIAFVKEFERRTNGVQESKGKRLGSTKKSNTSQEPHSKGTSASNDSYSPHRSERFLRSWPELFGIEPPKASRKENKEKKHALKGAVDGEHNWITERSILHFYPRAMMLAIC